MKQGQCGVYKLFKLAKGSKNTFTHEFKKLERDSHVVTHQYADLINQNSVINGSLYEYDEKSDALYWAKKPFKKEEAFAETTPFEEITEEAEKEESKIDELRAEYLDLSGKKSHHLWGDKKLTEEIEKLKK